MNAISPRNSRAIEGQTRDRFAYLLANQIESFFRSEEDRDVAIAVIESHIRRFWEPRMRAALIGHVEAGGEGLAELAKSAILKLAQASRAKQGS